MQINYVSSPCGSHKTTQAMRENADWAARGSNYILAQPTIQLVDATFERFCQLYPHIKAVKVHSNSCGNTSQKLEEVTKQAASEPGWCIFCTHTGLMQVPYLFDKEGLHAIYDECPSPIWQGKLDLKRNRGKILPAIDAYSAVNGYQQIVPCDSRFLDGIAKDSQNNIYSDQLKDFAKKMLSGYWNFHVLESQWQKVHGTEKKDCELLMFGLLDLSIFAGYASVTIMSANFPNTLLAQYMKSKNVTLKMHKRISSKLRFHTHHNGHLLTIYHAVSNKWSKHLRDVKFDVNGQETDLNQVIANDCLDLFGDEPFVKLVNKDRMKNDPFGGKGEMLPFKSYGLNTYIGIHNAAILPALNVTPAFYQFLEKVAGLDKDKVHHAIYCEEIYQTVVRISIRNPDDLNPKKIAVADEKASNFIHKMFPHSAQKLLPCASTIPFKKKRGRPVKNEDSEMADLVQKQQQKLRQRKKRWRERAADDVTLNVLLSNKTLCVTSTDSAVAAAPVSISPIQQGFTVSFWDSRAVGWRPSEIGDFEYHKNLIRQQTFTAVGFFEFLLQQASTIEASSKQHNDLFVPAAFDLKRDPDHGHSKSNHVFSQGIVLDVDDGELSPEQLHQVLPFQACAYSSWSHTPTARRYRFAFPTQPMSYDANEAMRRMCVRKIEEAYPDKKHGIDMSKMTPVALFFLPSVRPDGFFHIYQGQDFDHVAWIKDCPNDIIDKCMELSPNTPPEPDEVVPPKPIYAQTYNPIDEAQRVTNIRRTTQLRGRDKGTGRVQLWSLRHRLGKYTTLTDFEIEAILQEEAALMHNPIERRGEIPALMKQTTL